MESNFVQSSQSGFDLRGGQIKLSSVSFENSDYPVPLIRNGGEGWGPWRENVTRRGFQGGRGVNVVAVLTSETVVWILGIGNLGEINFISNKNHQSTF